MRGERYVQFADAMTEGIYRGVPTLRHLIEIGGVRSLLLVPLRRDDQLIGVITASRSEVRPFSSQEIALLENFAAQAVIAMENARLITETREALDQQTATAEVLQVINSSPGNLGPVFDAMLEKATLLCEADFGIMNTYDGEQFCAVATRGIPSALVDFYREPFTPGPGSYIRQLVGGEALVHVVDMAAANSTVGTSPLSRPGVERGRALVELGDARTGLFLALRKEGRLLGAFVVFRQEVRPFSDKQIALLQNFAAQAVIAMENARLLGETREALEQQTATAEVLGVINSSPGDLAPVYDAILEKAHSLCGLQFGSLQLFDGEHFRAVAVRFPRELPDAFTDRLRRGYRGADNPVSRPLLDGARFVHIPDLAEIDDPLARIAVEIAGMHTAAD